MSLLAVVDEIQARVPDFFAANVLTMNGEDLGNALEEGPEELGGAVERAWRSRGARAAARRARRDASRSRVRSRAPRGDGRRGAARVRLHPVQGIVRGDRRL